MEIRKIQKVVFGIAVAASCLLNVGLCEASPIFDSCKDRLSNHTIISFVGRVGSNIMSKRGPGNGEFVFSGLKVSHKFIQLLNMSSSSATSSIKSFMELPDDVICDLQYCQIFQEIINEIKTQHAGRVDYVSNLYYNEDKTLSIGLEFEEFFNGIFPMNFGNQHDIKETLDDVYKRYMEKHYNTYLDHNLDPQTDFYLLSALKVKPEVFKEYEVISSAETFTDINGNERNLRWLRTTGSVQFDIEVTAVGQVRIYQHDMIANNLYMTYFQPMFKPSESLDDKTRRIQDIFNRLAYFINKSFGTLASGTQTNLKSLTVPAMDIKTDIDLKPVLEGNMAALFRRNEIQNLYPQADSLFELRTLDNFNNEFSGSTDDVKRNPRDDKEETINSPFVFVLMTKGTVMPLKVGVYY